MTDVRERLARIISDVFACAIQNGEVAADAILAAVPELTAPDKGVVEGARELVAASEYVCGPCGAPLPNPDCGHAKNGVVGCCVPSTDQPLVDRIAAFATACVAREREACAELVGTFLRRLDHPDVDDAAIKRIQNAIRRRTP